ncbi:MAG: glycosyltransferase [Polyangiaceae bacterium]
MKSDMSWARKPRFLVVTPTRDSAAFLEETFESVLGQRFDGDLHYHVQDGGSSDDTLAIAERWKRRVDARDPHDAPRIRMTIASGRDRSMYDAINQGFAHLLAGLDAHEREDGRPTILTWINSDDRLAIGACNAVASLMATVGCEWVTGVASLLYATCSSGNLSEATGFDQRFLRQGRYDGRTMLFVQQEGTFWSLRLWNLVGGLDASFRLAGDWDLWRRFAEHAPLVGMRSVLGFHRKHATQLTSDMAPYWREVDARLADRTEDLATEDWYVPFGDMAAWDSERETWGIYRAPDIGRIRGSGAPFDDSGKGWLVDFTTQSLGFHVVHHSGLANRESWGAWSDVHLAPGVRLELARALPEKCALTFRMRVANPAACGRVRIRVGEVSVLLDVGYELEEHTIVVSSVRPTQTIDLEAEGYLDPPGDSRRIAIGLASIRMEPKDP